MSKSIEELKPSDRVMIRLGEKSHFDPTTGEKVVVEKAKEIDVPYSYFLEVTKHDSDYNAKNDYSKPLGRTVKLIGTAEFEGVVTEFGEKVDVANTVPLDKTKKKGKGKGKEEGAGDGDSDEDPEE
ncbi:hypothetical protein [Larkinella sp. C7]|uniref:hypothetical protein n=1 Tax=Larkinella sp. C7 TaxID=2576607 RepID=UPI0011113233|nr:hypothetical protein [Larkinella sp. C7]